MPGQSPEAMHIRGRNKNHCSYQSGLLMSKAKVTIMRRATVRPPQGQLFSHDNVIRSLSPLHRQNSSCLTTEYSAGQTCHRSSNNSALDTMLNEIMALCRNIYEQKLRGNYRGRSCRMSSTFPLVLSGLHRRKSTISERERVCV